MFCKLMFFGRVNLKQIEEKTAVGGPGACSSGKILYGEIAFLVLFELILIKLFALHSESFTKYDAFCSHIFDSCVLISGLQVGSESRKFW